MTDTEKEAMRERAYNLYNAASFGKIEVDDGAEVTEVPGGVPSANGGNVCAAWVQAWVWVEAEA